MFMNDNSYYCIICVWYTMHVTLNRLYNEIALGNIRMVWELFVDALTWFTIVSVTVATIEQRINS